MHNLKQYLVLIVCTAQLLFADEGLLSRAPVDGQGHSLSLVNFISPEDAEDVAQSGGYYDVQLDDGLRRFLLNNCATFPSGRIKAIKDAFLFKFFKGLTLSLTIASKTEVDSAFTELVKKLDLKIDSIMVPKVESCSLCRSGVDKDGLPKYCVWYNHAFHEAYIKKSLQLKPNTCPRCLNDFDIDYVKLFSAVKSGDADKIAAVVRGGIDSQRRDFRGDTAFRAAVKTNDIGIIKFVIKNSSGLTVGDIGTVRLLVENGAELDIVDRYGNTALKFALRYRYSEIVELLRTVGAKG